MFPTSLHRSSFLPLFVFSVFVLVSSSAPVSLRGLLVSTAAAAAAAAAQWARLGAVRDRCERPEDVSIFGVRHWPRRLRAPSAPTDRPTDRPTDVSVFVGKCNYSLLLLLLLLRKFVQVWKQGVRLRWLGGREGRREGGRERALIEPPFF